MALTNLITKIAYIQDGEGLIYNIRNMNKAMEDAEYEYKIRQTIFEKKVGEMQQRIQIMKIRYENCS